MIRLTLNNKCFQCSLFISISLDFSRTHPSLPHGIAASYLAVERNIVFGTFCLRQSRRCGDTRGGPPGASSSAGTSTHTLPPARECATRHEYQASSSLSCHPCWVGVGSEKNLKSSSPTLLNNTHKLELYISGFTSHA